MCSISPSSWLHWGWWASIVSISLEVPILEKAPPAGAATLPSGTCDWNSRKHTVSKVWLYIWNIFARIAKSIAHHLNECTYHSYYIPVVLLNVYVLYHFARNIKRWVEAVAHYLDISLYSSFQALRVSPHTTHIYISKKMSGESHREFGFG